MEASSTPLLEEIIKRACGYYSAGYGPLMTDRYFADGDETEVVESPRDAAMMAAAKCVTANNAAQVFAEMTCWFPEVELCPSFSEHVDWDGVVKTLMWGLLEKELQLRFPHHDDWDEQRASRHEVSPVSVSD